MSESFVAYLSIIDYLIIALMLFSSAAISVYYGYFKSKSNSVEDYMFGGRNMPVVPTCLSVMASTLSSIAFIAIPRETYYYGTVMIYTTLGPLTSYILLNFFYIPVFYNQKFTSIFEYTERRYGKIVRSLGSIVYAVTQIFYSLINMFASCTAVSQVTPIGFNILAPSLGILCTLYSVLGGLRGVVWSDVLQALFMIVSLITLNIVGFLNINKEESFRNILDKGGRWNHSEFDVNPFARYSMWSTFLSNFGLGLFNTCTNQGTMQRYMSLSSFKKVKLVIILSALSNLLFLVSVIILGTVIYATYYNCDPVLSKRLNDSNHFTIFYAWETGKKITGLTGLLVAGILSASLSSLSTMITSISSNIFEDVVKPALPWELNDKHTSYCIKTIALFCGLVVSFGSLAVDASGGINQIFRTMTSLTGGLIVFIFGFGIFFRQANTKMEAMQSFIAAVSHPEPSGFSWIRTYDQLFFYFLLPTCGDNSGVIAGSAAGLIITLWLGIGMQAAVSNGKIKYPTKVVTNEGCQLNTTEPLEYNITTLGYVGRVPVIFDEDLLYPYKITFNYLIAISITVSAIVGTTVSMFTHGEEPIDENLIAPLLRKKVGNINRDYCQHDEVHNSTNNVEMKQLTHQND